ncbi:MAG: POTRA domain-containing protein [Myxococcota bacterium]
MSHVVVLGTHRTKKSALLELLRYEPPAYYSEAELSEFARRINNLGIFDSVAIDLQGDVLVVRVEEKWTFIPSFDLVTGSTLKDTFILLGGAEYNAFGNGTTIEGEISYEQRGINFSLAVRQHDYHPRRWAMGGEVYHSTGELHFGNPDVAWTRQQTGGGLSWTAPYGYRSPLRYQVAVDYYREINHRIEGDLLPRDGHAIGTRMIFAWDQYLWRDLVASGYQFELEVTPSWLIDAGVAQSRHGATLTVTSALPLAKHTVLMNRSLVGVRTRGNVNFSYLLGSQVGVRGLEDLFYRPWTMAFTNLELRQGLPLARRWAVQGVAFADAAVFEQVDRLGQRAKAGNALSAGAGVRLLPTFLAQIVLRVDVARLFLPEQSWFVQFGTNQYF